MAENVDTITTIFSSENDETADRWVPIHDNVMGGVSEGGASLNVDSCLVFSGLLSLDNNGGFASVRTIIADAQLGGFNGLRIRVKGDGRSYELRLRVNDGDDETAFKHDFATVNNEWIDLDLPFSSFVPTYRGRVLRDVGQLEAGEITKLGFLLSDKLAGPFRLVVSEIVATR